MKKLLTIGLVGILLTGFTGCASLQTTNSTNNEDNNTTVSISNTTDRAEEIETNRNDEGFYVSPTDDIAVGDAITIGDIVEFAGDHIHIISGDLIEVFEYDNSTAEKFYLGQTVQLIKGEESNHLEIFNKEDYTIQHTNMGHPINQLTGKVSRIDTETLVIKNSDGTHAIKTYHPVISNIGDEVTVYTMTFNTSLSAIMVLNEESKLSLEVLELSRSDEGHMTILAKDADGGEYALNLSAATLELDMSTVTIGDTLTVYHQGIMESWPMQLDTILIRK